MVPFLQPKSQSCGFCSFQPPPNSPALPPSVHFGFFCCCFFNCWFSSSSARRRSLLDIFPSRAVFLGELCCPSATPILEQEASGISGLFPFLSFWLYLCYPSCVSSKAPHDRAVKWKGWKGKAAFKAMGFFCFVLPTACKKYQLMPLTLSHTCACLPPRVEEKSFARGLSLLVYHLHAGERPKYFLLAGS